MSSPSKKPIAWAASHPEDGTVYGVYDTEAEAEAATDGACDVRPLVYAALAPDKVAAPVASLRARARGLASDFCGPVGDGESPEAWAMLRDSMAEDLLRHFMEITRAAPCEECGGSGLVTRGGREISISTIRSCPNCSSPFPLIGGCEPGDHDA